MKTIKFTAQYDKWEKRLRDRQAVARIRIRLDRLREGNPGQIRNLHGGVVEMKVDFGPGYRVYYTEREGYLIILLCGGSKKGQDKDIALAVEMAEEI